MHHEVEEIEQRKPGLGRFPVEDADAAVGPADVPDPESVVMPDDRQCDEKTVE
jgi:hypothetical protein